MLKMISPYFKNYLKSHSYGNAVLEDLVYAFNQVS